LLFVEQHLTEEQKAQVKENLNIVEGNAYPVVPGSSDIFPNTFYTFGVVDSLDLNLVGE
jgi:hypothetical protein